MLYLDSSALIKRYLKEEGSHTVLSAMGAEEAWCSCRVAFVETARAVGRTVGVEAVGDVEVDWRNVEVVELDSALAERAAELAISSGLRSLDALHLAAALTLATSELTFATWDARLHRAAREHGLRTLPAKLA
jgi:uncharacterized protein